MKQTELQTFMSEARDCAMTMYESSTFIQQELPNVELEESLRTKTIDVCSTLLGTKFDIISEIFELDELVSSGATNEVISSRVDRILEWLLETIMEMHELVKSVESASDKNPAFGSAYILISESAVNILNSFNLATAAADMAKDGVGA